MSLNDDQSDKISSVLSDLSTMIVPYISNANPASMIMSTLLKPAITSAFKLVITSLYPSVGNQRACIRLGISYHSAIETINDNIIAGKPIRDDDLFSRDKDLNYAKADDILEATLQSAIRDTELKKSAFYGNFIGNIPFHQEYSYTNLLRWQKIISQLSYTELCILFCISKESDMNFDDAEAKVNQQTISDCNDYFHYLIELKNFGLLTNVPPIRLGSPIGRVKLSNSGLFLADLMKLNDINPQDIDVTMSILQQMIS